MTNDIINHDRQNIFKAVMITSFIGPFMGSSVNVAVPSIAADFGQPAHSLSWVVTAYLLGATSMLVPFGRLADILGRLRLYRIGALAVTATTFLAGAMTSVPSLLACRFLQGLALSMIFSTSIALLVAAHGSHEKGRVIGWSSAATYIGLSIGPTIGGLITQYISWRALFFITAAACLLSWRYAGRVAGEWYGKQGKMDYFGSLLYFAAMVMTLGGLSGLTKHPAMKCCLTAGLVSFVLFCVRQLKTESPVINLSLFKNKAFSFSSLAALLNYSSTFAIVFLISLYLQVIRGFSASHAGMFILIHPLIMALVSPKAGALSDRIEPRFISTAGMASTTLGIFAFSFLTAETSMYQVAATFIFTGTGLALFASPNNNAIMSAVPPEYYGIAASIVSVMRLTGQTLSMAIVTAMLSGYSDAAIVGPLQRIFTMLTCTGILASIFSMARGKTR